jgi:thioredoxin-like negative regulator of GroEL
MLVKIFWRENCPGCPRAKAIGKQLEEQGIKVAYLNVDREGLEQAMEYGIMSVPTIIVESDGQLVAQWSGNPPGADVILAQVRT